MEAPPAASVARLAAPLLGAASSLFYDAASHRGYLFPDSDDRELLYALCRAVVQGAEPLAIDDIGKDFRFRSGWPGNGVSAFAGVPVQGSAGRLLGVLGVAETAARTWTAADLAALADLGRAVSAVMEHDHLACQNQTLTAALLHSDARHRRLVATCPVAIYGLDHDGNFIELNQAAADVFGRSVAELMGTPFLSVVAPEDVELASTALSRIVTGRDAPGHVELRVVRPTGERRTLQITRAPIEQDEQIIGVQGIGRDVTDERAREAQFRRAERMASVAPLLSGVCHELNNPLTSIKSFAELLLLDERSADDREAIEIVAREAHRAANIVSDLRVVARQSQEAAASCGLVDLNEVVRQVLDTRRPSFDGVHVRLDLASGLSPAWAVRNQVEQVLSHLLSNAIHATRAVPGAPEVVISTFRGDFGVVLQVADRGPGIRPEDRNRIFDPFWTTRSPGEGTGLGLSLVNSIVTDHGGRIRVDSTPGSGATFSVELPAAQEAPAGADTGATDTPARRRLRVLVVDDEAPIRTSLSRYLERRGHEVAVAAEGGEALHLLEVSTNAAGFDIIVADLRMPGLSGEQFVARLRERGDGLEDRLIFITGDADSPDVEGFLREMGAPVVGKPFELAEVAQIIEVQAGMTMS